MPQDLQQIIFVLRFSVKDRREKVRALMPEKQRFNLSLCKCQKEIVQMM